MESLSVIPAVASLPAEITYAPSVALPSDGLWLTILVVFPAFIALILAVIPPLRVYGRRITLMASLIELVGFLALAYSFDWAASSTTQFMESYAWIPALGITWSLGVNALGLVMLLLTGLLVPLVLIAAKPEDDDPRRAGGYAALIMVLYSFIVMIFAAYDLVVFYIAFEAMLIPLFFMISRYGTGEHRKKAAMKFLLYSLAGGLIMLGGIVVIAALGGSGNGILFRFDVLQHTLPMLTIGWQMAIFVPLFLAFAIKAPMVPLHTWLPETAAAARPGTSTLLVGILDKIGTYGMIIMAVSFLPGATAMARPVILIFAVISILWGGFAANGQNNLLRLISFTSVSHFGFIVLGIFIGSEMALTGAMVYMVAHGLSIAGLFLISGFLISRGQDPSIRGYGGMQRVTPILAGTWLISGLASMALPGLSGFIPEYLVLMGTYKVNVALAIFAVFGVLLAAMYILMPYQRIFTGPVNPLRADIPDLNGREKIVVTPLIIGMILLGIWVAPLVGSMSQLSEHLAPSIAVTVVNNEGVDSALAPDLGMEMADAIARLNEGNAQ